MIETYGDYRTFSGLTHASVSSLSEHDLNATTEPSVDLRSGIIAGGGLRYGLSSRITLALQQSYIWLNTSGNNPSGFGDLLFTGTVQLFSKNDFSAAVIAGAELPTGKKSTLTGQNNLTFGSGSFDPVTGLSLLKNWQKNMLRLTFFYKLGTTGFDKTNFGSFFNPNLTYSLKLKGIDSECSSDSLRAKENSWSFSANIAGEWYGPQVKEHTLTDNTGGFVLLAGAGTQIALGKWLIPLTFSIPVLQDLRGEQNKAVFRTRLGILRKF
jgi:hypothetical protein